LNAVKSMGGVLAFLQMEVACSIMSGELDRRSKAQADAKGSPIRDRA